MLLRRTEDRVDAGEFSNALVAEAAELVGGVPAGEPVLLVDEVVGSRWTLTVVGGAC